MARVCVFEMPHESTAEPENSKFHEDEERLAQSRTRSRSLPANAFTEQAPPAVTNEKRTISLVAETPMRITHHHDDDDDDDSHAADVTVEL